MPYSPYSNSLQGHLLIGIQLGISPSKFFTTFYAILYVTGVYEADKKIFADVLKDIPLKYDSALKKRGERIKREQYNDALKAMDERTAKMKSEMKK